MRGPFQYCGYCGNSFAARPALLREDGCLECANCGGIMPPVDSHSGPALLVLVAVFANDRILLQRRGRPPYQGQWAPPGGFVERGESLEAAAVREVWEETQVKLEPTELIPSALISLPQLNQVCHGFIARLPATVPARAVPPESLEAGWFSEGECRALDSWEPASSVDIGVQFNFFRTPTFGIIQNTVGFLRLISADGIRYL